MNTHTHTHTHTEARVMAKMDTDLLIHVKTIICSLVPFRTWVCPSLHSYPTPPLHACLEH